MKPWVLHKPTAGRPYVGTELEATGIWRPYPLPASLKASFLPSRECEERFNLFEIIADTLPILLSGSETDSPLSGHVVLDRQEKLDAVRRIDERLLAWMQCLPSEMKLDPEAMGYLTPAIPVVDLQ